MSSDENFRKKFIEVPRKPTLYQVKKQPLFYTWVTKYQKGTKRTAIQVLYNSKLTKKSFLGR